jgi:hypothetical protein
MSKVIGAAVIRHGNKQYLYRVTVGNRYDADLYLIDEETIPEYVLDTLGIFGDTGNWRSKFSKVIDAQRALVDAMKEFEKD